MTTIKYTFATIALALLTSTAHTQKADRETFPYIPPAAKPYVGVLPPERFDGPYAGKLTVIGNLDAFAMGRLCPRVPGQPVTLGCSYRGAVENECLVLIAEDSIIVAAGWSFEIVFRHEHGHCVGGWSDHAGARPATPGTMGQR